MRSGPELNVSFDVMGLGAETGLGMSAEIDRYKQYASECVRLAQQTTDDGQKARLLEMAEAWRRLVQTAAKRDKT
jgi:hypothetical protein